MLISPRISTRQLANLCSRLSTSLEAGIDLRKVWGQEAERAGALAARSRFHKVSEAVNRGDSLAEALDSTGDTANYKKDIKRRSLCDFNIASWPSKRGI